MSPVCHNVMRMCAQTKDLNILDSQNQALMSCSLLWVFYGLVSRRGKKQKLGSLGQ